MFGFYFKIASPEEVKAKFDPEMAEIILAERRIVFWRYAPFWAMFGSAVTLMILIVSKLNTG